MPGQKSSNSEEKHGEALDGSIEMKYISDEIQGSMGSSVLDEDGERKKMDRICARLIPQLDLDVIQVYTMIIERYTTHFRNERSIPLHRALDISGLRALLIEDEITHVQLYEKMQEIINEMMTGLIHDDQMIISTKHSRLRSYLKLCMKHPRYNLKAMKERDARREKLKELYAAEKEIATGHELNVFDYLKTRNNSLQEACRQYQALLREKTNELDVREKTIQSYASSIQLLETRLSEAKNDVANAEQQSSAAQEQVNRLTEENKRLRLEKHKITVIDQKSKARNGFFGTFFQSSPDVKEGTCLVQDQPKEEESFFNAFLRLFD